jgi:hypothetical protein
MPINSSLTFRLGLKDFLTSCLIQFEVDIWSTTWCYNIDKYLNKIKEQTYITLDPSRVLGQMVGPKKIINSQHQQCDLLFSCILLFDMGM